MRWGKNWGTSMRPTTMDKLGIWVDTISSDATASHQVHAAYDTGRQTQVLNLVVESNDQAGEGSVQEHREDYCPMDGTFDES